MKNSTRNQAKRSIFVFGSNEAGRHGKGAALHAYREWGAIYGQGEGLQGDSYGIPTKNMAIKTLPLHLIKPGVEQFLKFAAGHPDLHFEVTAIGCGLAGYKESDIAPMFIGAPENCALPASFVAHIESLPGEAKETIFEKSLDLIARMRQALAQVDPENSLVSASTDFIKAHTTTLNQHKYGTQHEPSPAP